MRVLRTYQRDQRKVDRVGDRVSKGRKYEFGLRVWGIDIGLRVWGADIS